MLTFNLRSAHKFVANQKRAGNDVRWDNYDIVFFKPNPRAFYSKNGAFRNGEWGYENRFAVDQDGKWRVDSRNVITSRTTA